MYPVGQQVLAGPPGDNAYVPLIDSLATTPELAEIFSDPSVLAAMLQFEVALALVEARLGVIPPDAAALIAAAAKTANFDAASLCAQALQSGTLTIPFVKDFTEQVRKTDPKAAGFLHWGATSQDVADTAMVLLLQRALPILDRDLDLLAVNLRRLSDDHKDTVMLGRTLLQSAPPITFGLKIAGWLAAIERSRTRLNSSLGDALVLQFGGASGTLASLGDRGLQIGQALASELGLSFPQAPWHTHRDRLAALVADCGVLVGCLGKMARDISLLMQNEIAEVAEPSDAGRGGSSAMPQKHNPVGCVLTLAAAIRVPGMVAAYLSAIVQEHERGAGGWQAEWPILAGIVQSTGLAAASMAEVAGGLTVDSDRMRANLEANQGLVFAEKASMLLASRLGRAAAHKLLQEATRRSLAQKRRLAEVLGEIPEAAQQLDSGDLSKLEDPEDYLGSAEAFRQRLLARQPRSSESTKD